MSKKDDMFKQGVSNPAFSMFGTTSAVPPDVDSASPEPDAKPQSKAPAAGAAKSKGKPADTLPEVGDGAKSRLPNAKGRTTEHFMIQASISQALDLRILKMKRYYKGVYRSDIVNEALARYLADELKEIRAAEDD